MVDTKKYSDWFIKAAQDLRSAKILLENDGDLWVVVFHCQQAAEKYLKGFILAYTGFLLDGHNLYRLCKKASELYDGFKSLLKDSGYLSNYYVETRYPAEDPLIIDMEEVDECIRITENIKKQVSDALGLNESDE